ncbi:MAG: YebC/PmpR family DNA-binding transcriptional regulator [Candidatus Yanofskybacteria bacterium]|nr:YebC/PmpR family DNA-binding transcriptional regulator [Candidatus Yanofskybacteria bacterium]
MSGHSKWAQIRHKKALTDQKRGQIFSKFSKNITLAARKGTDPKTNIALANAIEQARRENMPNNNIERAIKKASEKDSTQLEEFVVEAIWTGALLRQGFGRQGVALRIKGVTDNKNRAISEIKTVLSGHEAKMVQPGSIGWMFTSPLQVNEQTQQKIDELLEALDNLDDVSDIILNLKLKNQN